MDYFYIVTAYPCHAADGEEQYQYIQPYCQYIIRRGYPRRAISYQQQVFQFYRILLEKQEDGKWIESADIIAGRIAKSKLTGYSAIQSVSYPKCDVEIPDAIVNQYANITEISQ